MQSKDNCKLCYIRHVCFPQVLNLIQQETFQDNVLYATTKIEKGSYLVRLDQTFENLHMIKHGSFKKSITKLDNREQIAAFYFQGEVMGFRASCEKKYTGNIIALEDSIVCTIKYDALEKMAQQYPDFQKNLLAAMSQRLSTQDVTILNATAKERVIAFLLQTFTRLYKPQANALNALKGVFQLSMSRDEIGAYLGLNAETISRMLTELSEENLIKTSGKHIELINQEALYKKIDTIMPQ